MKITGDVLKRAVFNDKRTQEEIAKEMGMVRQTLNNLFKRSEIDEDYIKAAIKAGLKFEPENDAMEVSFLKKQIELLTAHLEDVKREAETYRILLTNMTESQKTDTKKVKT